MSTIPEVFGSDECDSVFEHRFFSILHLHEDEREGLGVDTPLPWERVALPNHQRRKIRNAYATYPCFRYYYRSDDEHTY